MNEKDNYFKALLLSLIKPVFKETFQEFLSEHNLHISTSKTATNEAMINTAEACRFLGKVDRHTLYKYIDQGLPAFRSGKSYKFRISDLNEFINKNKKSK